MKQICVFLVVLVLVSCEYFNVKKTSPEAILKEELKTFNWKEVDAYPSFALCDTSQTKQAHKLCFEHVLTTHIAQYLQKESLIVTQDVQDTIVLKFQLSEKGVLALLNAKIDSLTTKEIPNIERLLVQSLDSLPRIFPALKRGQQVKTEFELPIIIKVN
ncbi:hypothetical protein [Snuella sedimenti]|uniref:TonB C-terminal domain-containing protein n=1 Tax=Snuella sedimenti TaxID=2798802 RepID=A0A8J7J2D2_9FLAO|nr:hypothetical protein [Snuella sedimenti]MBJ6367754.1 hypothetical protein [Snuella sedimenti]